MAGSFGGTVKLTGESEYTKEQYTWVVKIICIVYGSVYTRVVLWKIR